MEKKVLLYPLIALLVVFIGLAIYWVSFNLPDTGTIIEPSINNATGLKTYQNRKLDITFNYPGNWTIGRETFNKDEFVIGIDVNNAHEDILVIRGNNRHEPIWEDPDWAGDPIWFGICAESYKDANDFAYAYTSNKFSKGVEFINQGLAALDVRHVYHGEGGISALLFSDQSKKYPRICFELTLYEILEEIWESERAGVTYQDYLDNKWVSEDTFQLVDNLRELGQSIQLK